MISRMLKLSFPLALLIGCSSSSGDAPRPAVSAFTASPATIQAGSATTLSWSVSDATQVSIDQGLGVQQGTSVTVSPAATTTYTLTATGPGGTATASTTVTVSVPRPLITQFSASPSDVASGSPSTLSWQVTGAVSSLALSDGVHAPIDVTGTTSKAVTPDTVTTYTLTATNAGGSDTQQVTVSVHSPSLRLSYTDPALTTAKILVVRNAASTNNRLVLDVKVGAVPIVAFGFAMNIPLAIALPANTAIDGPFTADATLSPPGLIIGGPINVGASPATAALILGGPAMPSFLSVGVANHKTVLPNDGTWSPGSTLFSIVLKMVGSPATGEVFTGATVAGNPAFRAAALRKDGTEAVSKADIALGDFIISL